MKKMNNKGFSLVELIIVIAIMAILAAALAPQLIKYLEKSRESTDAQTCDTIKSSFNAALTNEDAYKEVSNKKVTKIEITFSGDTATFTPTGTSTALIAELKSSLAQIKAPKASGKSKYVIEWKVGASGTGATEITSVDVTTA